MYPEAKIKITGRSSPHTGAAGRPDLNADPSCDGFNRDRDGFLMTGRDRPGSTTADVIDLITDDHARIRRLFAALDEFARDGEQLTGSPAPSGDDRMLGETWSVLSSLLDAHIDAEEEICRLVMTQPVSLMTGWKHPSPTTGTFRKRSPKRSSARLAHAVVESGGGRSLDYHPSLPG